MSNADDDVTSPDLGADEPTRPGRGVDEAFIAIGASRLRALAALQTLEATCPPRGATGRRRHLEVLRNAYGEVGMLYFDSRRVTNELIRAEFDEGDDT